MYHRDSDEMPTMKPILYRYDANLQPLFLFGPVLDRILNTEYIRILKIERIPNTEYIRFLKNERIRIPNSGIRTQLFE